MEKRIYILLVIIVSLLAYIIFLTSSSAFPSSLFNFKKEFKWGVGIVPYPTGPHSSEVLSQVIHDAKDLGVGWIRVGWPDFLKNGEFKVTEFEYLDKIVTEAEKVDLAVVLGIGPEEDYSFLTNPYQQGFDRTYKIAQYYQNKISYYQLANEPAASCLKKDWPGLTKESFDLEKCQAVIEWLKGASDGINQTNKKAKRIISGHWLHVGFMQILKDQNLDFEIIGWDWNGWGTDLTNIKSDGEVVNLVKLLKSFGKELWITEVNSENGSLDGEEKQADYLKEFLTKIYQSGDFSAAFVFRLHDEMHKIDTSDAGRGLIGLTKNKDGLFSLGTKKKAYYIYQELIKKFP